MKVKSLRDFYDLAEQKQRTVGSRFNVTDERAAELIAKGYVEISEEKTVERPVSVPAAVSEKE